MCTFYEFLNGFLKHFMMGELDINMLPKCCAPNGRGFTILSGVFGASMSIRG